MKNEIEKLKQQLSQAQSLAGCAMDQNFYLKEYTDNVFPPARTAIAEGRFHDMFMEGDGHELEDYVCNGKLYPAHARAVFSSSMLAFNFFHWLHWLLCVVGSTLLTIVLIMGLETTRK